MKFCFLGQHEWVDDKSDGFFNGGSSHCSKCHVSQGELNDPTPSLLLYTSIKLRQMGLGYCPCCKQVGSHNDTCYLQEMEKQFDAYLERQIKYSSSPFKEVG